MSPYLYLVVALVLNAAANLLIKYAALQRAAGTHAAAAQTAGAGAAGAAGAGAAGAAGAGAIEAAGKAAASGAMAPDIHAYFSVPFVLGVICFGLNLLAYTQALRKLPISSAYPIMVSAGYLIILAVSWLVFQERLSAPRYAGAALMLAGLWLLVR